MKTKYFIFLISCLVLGACTKVVVGVAKQFVDIPWEKRAEGIRCPNSASQRTFEEGELSFNPYHMLCVNVEMDPVQFETMRFETRFGPSLQEDNGAAAMIAVFQYLLSCDTPFPKKYNWYNADLNVDGITIEKVGIRKKGFVGSILSKAPSIKIQTDKFLDGQVLNETKSITLGNNSQDPSRIIQTLRYHIIEKAGYPAPRCNLANVSINGEALGVYSHIESVKENLLIRAFNNSNGDLYEGQAVDFIRRTLPRWDAKTQSTSLTKDPIIRIADVLELESDTEFLQRFGDLVNIERFITFWALEFILEHGDGYTTNRNNFFVYFDPNDQGRATFIPWGMNDTEFTTEKTSYVASEIPRRLSRVPEVLEMLDLEIRRIMDTFWDEEALLDLTELLSLHVESAQLDPEYEFQITFIQDWINSRRANVASVLEAGLAIGNEESTSGCLGK